MVQNQTRQPLWCDHCDTGADIVIGVVCRRHWCPPGQVEVTYFCTRCDAMYGHLVTESAINNYLMDVSIDSGKCGALRADTVFRELKPPP